MCLKIKIPHFSLHDLTSTYHNQKNFTGVKFTCMLGDFYLLMGINLGDKNQLDTRIKYLVVYTVAIPIK